MARVIADGTQDRFYTDASLFNAALSPLTRGESSAAIFHRARFAMLALFWLNLGLLAACAGGTVEAWLGAATLAPVWDYGLEVRHDNLLLAGLLAIWLLLFVRRGGAAAFFAAGAVAAILQLAIFKSFVYWAPLSALLVLRARESRKAAAWFAGFLILFVAARLAYGGLWDAYAADFRSYLAYTAGTERFLPFGALSRLIWQTPLLLVLLGSAFADAWKRRSLTPEGALCAGALFLLFINPTPYPYNLLNFVPFAFLLALRHGRELARRNRRGLVWAAVLFAHLAPFCAATARHARWTNERQELLMAAAESVARPGEPVYDAIGMVPTRPAAGFHWYLQSLVARNFLDGTWPSVREMLARNPPPVLIPSYRTDWLAAEDQAFFRERYSPVSDDFWVRKDRVDGKKIEPRDHGALFVNWY
jgi:hypothetical protein